MAGEHCNERLEPETAAALGGVSPATAWEQVVDALWAAFTLNGEESNALMQVANREPDLAALDLHRLMAYLESTDAVVGLNEFHYINPSFDLTHISETQPLEVLKAVLRIFTVSDRWASRDHSL